MMTKKEDALRTYVAIILDRSGSMGNDHHNPNRVDMTIAGFNEQVQQIKMNSEDMETFVSLVTFNGNVYEHLWNQPAAELYETTAEDYRPSGSTAMRDALGYVIEKLQKTTDIADENNAYLVVVISDGDDNTSHHYSIPALRELVESTKKDDNWTITYMGCSEEYLKEVEKQTAIPTSNMAAFDPSAVGIRKGYAASGGKIGEYLRSRKCDGVKSLATFYSDTAGVAADFTEAALNHVAIKDTIIDSTASNLLGSGVAVAWDDGQ